MNKGQKYDEKYYTYNICNPIYACTRFMKQKESTLIAAKLMN